MAFTRSRFAARMCNYVAQRREQTGIYKEIAEDLIPRIIEGNLLDIGTGAGLFLKEVNKPVYHRIVP